MQRKHDFEYSSEGSAQSDAVGQWVYELAKDGSGVVIVHYQGEKLEGNVAIPAWTAMRWWTLGLGRFMTAGRWLA